MSLKIRLVLILSAVLSIGIAVGGVFLWLHARAAMRSEIDTALHSAERLISALRSQPGLPGLSAVGLTESLDRLRHVRVVRPDAGPLPPENTDVAGVPRWFSRLIAPDTEGFEPIDLTVGGAHEQVILQADPSDEIREVWQDVRGLMVIAAAMCLCVGGLAYLGLARGLRPLADLEAAFDRLEAGDFETRVPEGAVPELDRIHKRFNHMAAVLCSTRARERTLASRLVEVQEAERRGLARELHDDLAPLLFTSSVYLTTIENQLQTRQHRNPGLTRGDRAYRRRASGAHTGDTPATAPPGSGRAGPRSGAARSGRDLAIPSGPHRLGDRDVGIARRSR